VVRERLRGPCFAPRSYSELSEGLIKALEGEFELGQEWLQRRIWETLFRNKYFPSYGASIPFPRKPMTGETKLTVSTGIHPMQVGDKIRIGDEGIFTITDIDISKQEITVKGEVSVPVPLTSIDIELVLPEGEGYEGIDMKDADGNVIPRRKKKPNNLTRPYGEWKVSA
jgi:hypothetical protein